MQLQGVHHVGICVSEIEPALAFYTEVLGLEQLPRPDLGLPGAWLQCGDQQVHLMELPLPEGKGQHFAFRVDDIDTAVADLVAKGFSVSPINEMVGICRQAMTHDPSGNMVELNQPLH
jgi:catechol 2,3-dioxygenase-like lactoylglutathione lyase family enzyme